MQTQMPSPLSERLRWKLWGFVTRLPGVCPANAHRLIIDTYPDRERSPFIDRACREGVERCGSCWCGKLRTPMLAAPIDGPPCEATDDIWTCTRPPHSEGDHASHGTSDTVPVRTWPRKPGEGQ